MIAARATRRKRRPVREERERCVGVAQPAEQRILTPTVVGSIPTASTDHFTTDALASASVAQVVEHPVEARGTSVRFRPEALRWRSSRFILKGDSGRALVSKTGARGFDSSAPCHLYYQRPEQQRY